MKKINTGLHSDWKDRVTDEPDQSEDIEMYGILPSDGRRSRSASSGISGLSSMPATTPGSDDDQDIDHEGGISDNAGEGDERDKLNKAHKIDLKKQQYFGGGSKAKGTSVGLQILI
jgi:hypothetical protein